MVIKVALVVLLILALVGALPVHSYSREWPVWPSGGLATILLVVVILWLLGLI